MVRLRGKEEQMKGDEPLQFINQIVDIIDLKVNTVYIYFNEIDTYKCQKYLSFFTLCNELRVKNSYNDI